MYRPSRIGVNGLAARFRGGSEKLFDGCDEFVPAHLPDTGPCLDEYDVLTGMEHGAVHRLASRLFERRGVYDLTFSYNLARLNLDQRHPEEGYRYAVEAGDTGPILLAEFTPTTPFCPQTETLTDRVVPGMER